MRAVIGRLRGWLVRDWVPIMTHPTEPSQAHGETVLDGLVKSLDRAGRASNKVLVRWVLDVELPLLSACVLVTLDPDDTPMSSGDVAEAIGISVDEAIKALRELVSLGYAREDKRRYEPTDQGLQLHASLIDARREALDAFLTRLSEEEQRDLAGALANAGR